MWIETEFSLLNSVLALFGLIEYWIISYLIIQIETANKFGKFEAQERFTIDK